MQERFRPYPTKSGFTLIELSIVLFIIGLVIGGVMMGRELIRQAELRAVTSQFQTYITAVKTFQSKYNCLPGDCAFATSLFGDAGDCSPNGNGTYNATYSGTCNGNGNGHVGVGFINGVCGNSEVSGCINSGLGIIRENFTFWQQLFMAGLIKDGPYSGAYGGASGYAVYSVPRVNAPDSIYPDKNPRSDCCGFGNLVWHVTSSDYTPGSYNPRYGFPPYINSLTLASSGAAPAKFYWMGMIPSDQQWLDSKIDDGSANTGKVVTTTQTGNCYNASTGAYTLTTTTGDCSPVYKNAF